MTGRGARELGRGRWARVILAAGAEGEGQSEGKSKSRDEGEGESEGQGEARFERAQHLPLHARRDLDGAGEAGLATERRLSAQLGVARARGARRSPTLITDENSITLGNQSR